MHNALILHYEPVAGQTIPAEVLTTQLALLKKLKIPVVSLEQLVENNYLRRRWHRHVVVLSCTSTFLARNPTVFKTFKTAGFPLTVFVAASEEPNEMQQDFLQKVKAAGFSVGLHSVSEVAFTRLPAIELQQQLRYLKAMLEAETESLVRYLLPAAHDCNKRFMSGAREIGFEALLTRKTGYNKFNADLFRLKTWSVPPQTSLHVFEKMVCRDKKELVLQDVKAKALKTGSKLRQKSLFGKLKGLLRRVRV